MVAPLVLWGGSALVGLGVGFFTKPSTTATNQNPEVTTNNYKNTTYEFRNVRTAGNLSLLDSFTPKNTQTQRQDAKATTEKADSGLFSGLFSGGIFEIVLLGGVAYVGYNILKGGKK